MADITGTSGDDELFGTTEGDVIRGDDGKDTIRGLEGNDEIHGEDGNDRLFGDQGDDVVYGGLGNDTLIGDSGNDTLYGGEGNDGFFGGGNDDTIYGEDGNDHIFGDGGNDQIFGGADDDRLNGGSGHDTLDGGTGVNELNGNSGNDTLIHRYQTSTTTVDGGTGIDTLEIAFEGAAVNDALRADLAALKDWFDGNLADAGGDVNVLAGQSTGTPLVLAELGLTVSNIEQIVVKVDGVETPIESFLNQAPEVQSEVELETNEDASVSGRVEATDADGDVLEFSVAQGPANGELVLDEATGEFTYVPNENFSGDDVFDVVVTDPSGATATQRVTVTTQAVADQPVFNVAQAAVATGASVVEGTNFNDVLFGNGEAVVSTELDISAELVDVDGSETLSVTISNLPDGATLSAGVVNPDGTVTLAASELEGLTVTAQTEADFTLSVTATVTEENGDQATSTSEINVAIDPAANVNDVIFGHAGHDRIYAGRGDDVIHDGDGNDRAFGGSGDDTFIAGSGNDRYHGGRGFDTLDFSEADSGVFVNAQRGYAVGNGVDRFRKIEEFVGSDHNDKFVGSRKNDVFVGGDGNDIIRGGKGSDTLTGGEGEDTFTWKRSDVRRKQDLDVITDFNAEEDTLDLSALNGRHGGDVRLSETDEGTVVSVQIGRSSNYRDVVLLEDVFGLDVPNGSSSDWLA